MADLITRLQAATAPARKAAERAREIRELRTATIIAELDLTEPLVQGPRAEMPAALLQRGRPRLTDVLLGLAKAARDPRVVALLAKVGSARMGYARAQELREAVGVFRAAGKPAIAWAESFGEWGPGTVPYYLATAFEEIWLQPIGDVTLTGVTMGNSFLRGALDKLDIEPQFGQRYEYKNAVNVLQQRSFTEPHREAVERVAHSIFDTVIGDIADARRLPADRVREFVDAAPVCASDALDGDLVDHVGYRDEVYAAVQDRFPDAKLQFLSKYLQSARSHHGGPGSEAAKDALKPETIALIWGIGQITEGRRGRPLPGHAMTSGALGAAFRAAIKDPAVGAIVFRVDSPGGSASVSDSIWREVVQAKASGRPVVVSMGDVAGSGGYYVSMAADAIVAQRSTITGSIGVLSGKLMTGQFWDRIGITYDSVAFGSAARMFSPRERYSDDERAALDRWLDRVYEVFVGKVAQGRGLTRDEVHAVAKGRIWTGADAKERGLVDEIGGLTRAVEIAKQKAGIPAAHEVEVVEFPKAPLVDRLIPAQSSEGAAATAGAGIGMNTPEWLTGLAGVLGDPGPLTMEWVPDVG